MSHDPRLDVEDQDLLRRIVTKDATAFSAFFDRYNQLAFSLVFRILKVREDAEDVLVDVFWQVWRQADRYDPSRGKPVAWLLTIARTRAIDSLRSGSRRESATESPVAGDPPLEHKDPFVLADTRRAVREALKELPESQRVALEMAYFDGMSHTEIAAALNKPLGTMKDHIRNGMLSLRKRLKAYL